MTEQALSPLSAIHRAGDGIVSLWPNKEEKIKCESAPSSHLVVDPTVYFSLTLNRLFAVDRFSVNSMRSAVRSVTNLKYLTANVLHLTGTSDATLATMLSRLLADQQRDRFTPPGVILTHSEGLWLLWPLYDPDTGVEPLADWPGVRLYRATQAAVGERFRDLEYTVTVPSITTAVPVVASNEGRVQTLSHSGQPYRYTRDELASYFGVSLDHLDPPSPRGSLGVSERVTIARETLGRFRKLYRRRSTLTPQQALHAVRINAFLLAAVGTTAPKVLASCRRLARKSRPAITQEECDSHAFRTIKRGYRFKRQTIADLLQVTPDEADKCRLPPARNLVQSKQQNIAQRRARLLQLIDTAHGCRPSLRTLAKILQDEGHRVGHEQVRRDLAAVSGSFSAV